MNRLIIQILFILCTINAMAQRNHINEDALRKLQMVHLAISNLYVEDVDENKLVEDAIRGMLEKLDPHSSYSTPKETKEMTAPLQGNFEGIGVQFNMMEDTLLVVGVIHNGPSEKVGILAGDRIIAVNDTAIAGVKMERSDIMGRLRGKKGTKVNVTVLRRSERDPLHFTIKRDKIPLYSVDAAYLIEPGIAYVRVGNFGATTHKEMMAAVDSLRQLSASLSGNVAVATPSQTDIAVDDINALINLGKPNSKNYAMTILLDLQDNGGGYLSAAEEMSNEFLQKGDMLVYSEGRYYGRQEKRADGKGRLQNDRVIVLTNEYTASAAEIVSGAIQDHDRGTIVGRRTFGKGLVQRPVELADGSMIRLTVAHYYTPSGRCIQKPYKPGDKKEYNEDIEHRFKHGELTCRDSIKFVDSLRYETTRLHRPVYGGGGIMPDEFVPLDTTIYTKYHRSLVAKSIVTTQVLRYYDANRKKLKSQYKTLSDFIATFAVPQSLKDAIYAEGKDKKVEPKDDDERTRTDIYLTTQIKALLARDLFNQSAYFEVMNPSNPIYNRAVEIAKEKSNNGPNDLNNPTPDPSRGRGVDTPDVESY